MPDYRKRRIIALAAALFVVVGVGAWMTVRSGILDDDTPAPRDPLLNDRRAGDGRGHSSLPLSKSPYRNTGPSARFVGSAACRECHPGQHAAFARTPHNRALGDVDAAAAPEDAEFVHQKSGRTYRVFRRDGRLWHASFLTAPGGERITLGEYPVQYTIGSGHHSRSYLFAVDGFLMESPITWYASTRSWKLSPGYDSEQHWSFTRNAREECIQCHAGRIEPVGGSTHKVKFHEQRIGCESCHGPGSLHVAARRDEKGGAIENDDTIVHPAKLSRALNEAICARCHLRAASFVNVRGRSDADFRPGLPMTDFRVDFQTRTSDDSMTVTGHFEQMRNSRCYTESKTMTCTTCHNPHDSPKPAESIAYFRQKCLSCHETDGGCKLPEKPRLKKSPRNNCVECHMPRSGTDIPHFAFTHHRIAVKHNREPPPKVRDRLVDLVPIGDISQLPPIERERCFGLGELEYSEKVTGPARQAYRNRAMQRLLRVHAEGVREAVTLAGLARLFWEQGDARCLEMAEAVLRDETGPPTSKVNANLVLGDWHLQRRQYGEAAKAFRRLTTIRRWPDDWQLLGLSLLRNRQLPPAIRALEKAVAIRRDRPDWHALLAEAYQRNGQSDKAKQQQRLADRLAKSLQAVRRRKK